MSDAQRESIQPEDWPDEEGRGEAQDGLRSDVGTSQGTPKQEMLGGSPDPDGDGDRGKLGSLTPGSKGSEQGPR